MSDIPADWDGWLAKQGIASGFCQTSAWARIHATVNNATSYVLSVNRGGKRVAGVLLSLRPVGWTNSLRRTLECFEGPVLAEEANLEDLATLLNKVRELARQIGVARVRFSGPPPLARWAGDPDIGAVFHAFDYKETKWLTSIVDLTQDEKVLLSQFRQSARKGIRKSKEASLVVRICESLDEFENIFCAAYYETGMMPRNLRCFWRADRERVYRFFVVQDEKELVYATLGTYRHQGMATEILSRRTTVGLANSLPAQDLLHWEAMRYHKGIGDSFFNLAGYSPAPADEKEVGIRRFKEKWGGEERPVPIFTWTAPSPMEHIGRWLSAKMITA